MIDSLCKFVARIVNSHINGIVMIPILAWVIWTIVGQVVETIEIFKEV